MSESKKKTVKAISVTCTRGGFRRAGFVFGKDPVVIKLSDLSREQIKHIKAESLLTVTEVEVDEEISAE